MKAIMILALVTSWAIGLMGAYSLVENSGQFWQAVVPLMFIVSQAGLCLYMSIIGDPVENRMVLHPDR